jgi:exosortase/archaeosortase family protein
MELKNILNEHFIWYVLKFAAAFCIFYFGTLAVIGLSTPESYYSPFVANYLDYISLLRSMLLHATKAFLSLFNFETVFRDRYTLMGPHGGIRIVYSCIGYGVMSFWAAFVFANKGSIKRKTVWIIAGLIALCGINILRLSLLTVAINKNWSMPLGIDHHTWFNIAAYSLIFIMIYIYDRSSSKSKSSTRNDYIRD